MYGAFAKVYDRLMRDVDYSGWAAHYARLLAERGFAGGAVCECACGTGALTLPLFMAGFRMTGVDVSADMLAIATEKAAAAGAAGRLPFICQDMQKLALHRKQEAILCTCDGVNYLDTKERVLRFFCAANVNLRQDGILAFDVSTPDKLSQTLGCNTLGEAEDDLCVHWQNQWSERTRLVRMRLSVFIKNAQNTYDRIDEAQTQRAHSREELTMWLAEAGFSDIRFTGETRMTPPRSGDQRWHITGVKTNELS